MTFSKTARSVISISRISGFRAQSGLVAALALCMMFLLGCSDTGAEQTTRPMEVASPPTPISSTPQPTAAETRLEAQSPVATKPTRTSVAPTPTTMPQPSATATLPGALTPIVPTPVTPTETPSPSTAEATPEPPVSGSQPLPAAPSSIIPPADDQFGETLLKERINYSNAIVRVRLLSVEPAAAHIVEGDFQEYEPAFKFKFKALEYLRGSGGSEITVIMPYSNLWFTTEQAALDFAPKIVTERDTRWDDREAIVFLSDDPWVAGDELQILTIPDLTSYTIDSPINRTWLPAAEPDASRQTTGNTRFLLDVPVTDQSGVEQAPTITLSDLRSLVTAENKILEDGAARHDREEYRKCLAEKYRDERMVESGNLEYKRHELGPVDSGLAAGTRIGDPDYWGRTARDTPGERIEENDAYLFSHKPLNFHVERPLPSGEYRFYWSFWSLSYIDRAICDAEVRPEEIRKANEVFVTVTSPASTPHEFFFDPVVDTSTFAVGADSTNGVLKPASFADSGGATTTISRLEWATSTVKLNVSSTTGLANHVLDFIELDGTVSLSLAAADARVDTAANILIWSVESQPWEDGDKLMVRIRRP